MAQAIGQQQELVESMHESGRTTHGDIESLEEELEALCLKGEATNVPQPVLEEPGLPMANTHSEKNLPVEATRTFYRWP
ncbi:hypothetical protein H2248_011409 [Termitomyces sp. 'cryptogamus']|nr:hypothetical protein H2248_011409 [Termitomyces sp. 'cryptogamus']